MTKRRIFQLCAVTAAAFVALGAVAISGHVFAATNERNLEYGYQRAFHELSTYVASMESALDKGAYANTATQQTGLAARLMQDAGGAKASLSALPLKGDTMDTVQKFLSQVEDFSTALTKKVAAGIGVDNKDRETLAELYNYAALLKADLALLQNQFDQQDLAIGESTKLLSNLELEKDVPTFGDALAEYAEDFKDYPTLIYDGPFSDHIAQQSPKFLKGKSEISEEEALEAAAAFLSVSKDQLQHTSDTDGNLPTYNLTCGTKTVRVTKQGGIPVTMMDSRTVAQAALDYEQAKEKAQAFLKQANVDSVKESYYVINDNVCTIQFFTEESGAIVYTDLVKVSVALDNGEICGYNSTGYVMNHHSRTLSSPSVSLEEAKKAISPALKIKSEQMAIIPTAGLHEVTCYELLCSGKNEEEVLVYLNADTGMEEQILILLRSDNGVLTI